MWIQCNSCQSRYMFWWQVKVCILISASGLFLPIGHNFTPTWISTFCMCIMVYVAHYVWWISQNSTDGHTKRAAVTLCAGPPGQWFNPQQPHLSLTSAFLCSSVSTRQLCWPSGTLVQPSAATFVLDQCLPALISLSNEYQTIFTISCKYLLHSGTECSK